MHDDVTCAICLVRNAYKIFVFSKDWGSSKIICKNAEFVTSLRFMYLKNLYVYGMCFEKQLSYINYATNLATTALYVCIEIKQC